MGVAVSNWSLARAVSRTGQLGVVSGTALGAVLVRSLQDGDPGGFMQQAMEVFPLPDLVERVPQRYFIPGGKSADKPYRSAPITNLGQKLHVAAIIGKNPSRSLKNVSRGGHRGSKAIGKKQRFAGIFFPGKPYVSIENPDNRARFDADPRGFLANYEDGAIFDEAQNCPDLFSYLQEVVDNSPR